MFEEQFFTVLEVFDRLRPDLIHLGQFPRMVFPTTGDTDRPESAVAGDVTKKTSVTVGGTDNYTGTRMVLDRCR